MINEGYAKPYSKYCEALSSYQMSNAFAKANKKGLYDVVTAF